MTDRKVCLQGLSELLNKNKNKINETVQRLFKIYKQTGEIPTSSLVKALEAAHAQDITVLEGEKFYPARSPKTKKAKAYDPFYRPRVRGKVSSQTRRRTKRQQKKGGKKASRKTKKQTR
jgi:hypothetical protein